jgi:hypothetical protein
MIRAVSFRHELCKITASTSASPPLHHCSRTGGLERSTTMAVHTRTRAASASALAAASDSAASLAFFPNTPLMFSGHSQRYLPVQAAHGHNAQDSVQVGSPPSPKTNATRACPHSVGGGRHRIGRSNRKALAVRSGPRGSLGSRSRRGAPPFRHLRDTWCNAVPRITAQDVRRQHRQRSAD